MRRADVKLGDLRPEPGFGLASGLVREHLLGARE